MPSTNVAQENKSNVDAESTKRFEHLAGGGSIQSHSTRSSIRFSSGLDFERVVNEYSIQATLDLLHGQKSPRRKKQRSSSGAETSSILDDEEPQTNYDSLTSEAKPLVLNEHVLTADREFLRFCLSILTGLLTGFLAIFIVRCTDSIQSWRSAALDAWWKASSRNHLIIWFFPIFATINLSLALVSGLLCVYVAPDAGGSGIPEIKAYLNGVRVKRFSSMALLFVKVAGTILSVSSGLAIGPEAPIVHIGAILGASCTKVSNVLLQWIPSRWFEKHENIWSFVTSELSSFSTDAERRDLVSIGAAAGFSAAFGTPIGGLLFSMEETSTYLHKNMFLRTLAATAVATFCLAVNNGSLNNFSVISLANFRSADSDIFFSRVVEVPLYLTVAIIGGILGGCFCKVWKSIQELRRECFATKTSATWRLVEVAAVSILTSCLTYFVPLMSWTCRRRESNFEFFHEAHQFNCPDGEINVLAGIFFGSREAVIQDILSNPNQFNVAILFVVGLVFFPLMTLTLGVALPTGIFLPTFLIGTSIGGASGMIFQELISPEISSNTFALLGAAALLAGIQRSTVSLCVILVEGTGLTSNLIPVIITVVTARYVADMIHPNGLYETGIETRRYPFLHHGENRMYDVLQVRDIMSSPVISLHPREKAETLMSVLQGCRHHGFPVVDATSGKFLGLVRRDQLVALLECGVFESAENTTVPDDKPQKDEVYHEPPCSGVSKSPFMRLAYHIPDDRYDHMEVNSFRPQSVSTADPDDDEYDRNAWLRAFHQGLRSLSKARFHNRSLLRVGDSSLPALPLSRASSIGSARVAANVSTGNVYISWIEPSYRDRSVNIGAVMNQGTYIVTDRCPVSKAQDLFTALGLRHLVVLGGPTGAEPIGMITRINLVNSYIEERTGYKIHCE